MARLLPISPELLFTETEEDLLDQIQTRIFTESQGTLDDFSPASPLSAITEGQSFATVFLGEFLNDLPLATVIRLFSILGLTRSSARNALVAVEFVRANGYTLDIIIPAGFRMFTQDGIVFTLDNPVILSEAVPRAIGFATSQGVGSINNIEANSLNGFSTGIPGLESINNPIAAKGGADVEDINTALARGLSFLTFRHLLSPRDFETAASLVLGELFTVKALSYFEVQDFLNANDPTFIQGGATEAIADLSRRNVYLVATTDEGFAPNEPQRNRVINYLSPRLQAGTEIVFLNPSPVDLTIDTVSTVDLTEPLASRFATAVELNQRTLYRGVGRTIPNELFYQIAEGFFPVASLDTSILDLFGNTLVTYSSRVDNVISPAPTTVFKLRRVTVTGANGVTFVYDINEGA